MAVKREVFGVSVSFTLYNSYSAWDIFYVWDSKSVVQWDSTLCESFVGNFLQFFLFLPTSMKGRCRIRPSVTQIQLSTERDFLGP